MYVSAFIDFSSSFALFTEVLDAHFVLICLEISSAGNCLPCLHLTELYELSPLLTVFDRVVRVISLMPLGGFVRVCTRQSIIIHM